MKTNLYGPYHEDTMTAFAKMLMEAEQFDENEDEGDKPVDSENPTEDNVFSKLDATEEYPEETNANIFISRSESGSFDAVSSSVSLNDPAIRGLCAVISGDIIKNTDSISEYVNTLFDNSGINDISPEDFKKVKDSIWSKLEKINMGDPITAYSDFKSYVLNIVNGIRSGIKEPEPSK